jgi:putative spermidine/putrescine transport system permease protein
MKSVTSRDRLADRYRRFGTATAVLVYAFLLLPSLLVIPISFGGENELHFPPHTFSLQLYEQFFSSPSWMNPFWQSLRVAIVTTIASLVLAVPAAYASIRYEFPGKQIVMVLLMSPVVVPVIVTALALYLYFSYLGIAGSTAGLILAHIVYVTPFVMVTVAAGVRKLDPALEFAATMMGATRFTTFRRVVLPQLGPSILAGGLFAFLISFDEVVLAWFLTGAQTSTLPVKMYSSIQWEISPVIAAVSTLLTVLSFILCSISAVLQPSAARELQSM